MSHRNHAGSSSTGYISIGTRLLDEKQITTEVRAKDRNQYLPAHKQEVRDEHGRRRLHGAFTGGFSAGYFNTVGSKEGWQPSQFKSSRDQRASYHQKPEDFMDDEDLMELGYNDIKTSEQFDILGATERELKQRRMAAKAIDREDTHGLLSESIVDDLVVPSSDPVGTKLLRQMGWREGQGIGPRRKRRQFTEDGSEDVHASQHLFAPKDQSFQILTAKIGLHGLGFVTSSSFTSSSHETNQSMRDKSTRSRNDGFGIGVFEDDDDMDVYDDKPLTSSRFDSIVQEGRESLRKEIGIDAVISSSTKLWFVPATKSTVILEKFSAPIPPDDYKPKAPLQDRQLTSVLQLNKAGQILTPDARRDLLGEEKINAPERSVFSYLSLSQQSRIQEFAEKAKKFAQGQDEEETHLPLVEKHVAEAALQGFMPFGNDQAKQSRYKQFLMWKAGHVPDKGSTPEGMGIHDRQHELLEFAKAALIFQPLASVMANRFTTAKESDLISGSEANRPILIKEWKPVRTISEWRPLRLVCKRFQVPPPHVIDHKDEEGTRRSIKESQNQSHWIELTQSEAQRGSKIELNDSQRSETSVALAMQEDTDDINIEIEEVPPRPEMDIFKAIFADDSDEEVDNDDVTNAAIGNSSVDFFSSAKMATLSPQSSSKTNQNYQQSGAQVTEILSDIPNQESSSEQPIVLFKPVFKRKEERVTKKKAQIETNSSERKELKQLDSKKRLMTISMDEDTEEDNPGLILTPSISRKKTKKKMKVQKDDEPSTSNIPVKSHSRPSAADFM